ncbi:hypothetical protein A3Q56_07760 [Intoshia linei]|uniref:Uncharacterized protein n=1 Tax=Intoshia linei TaxID=1819745 RepID=A0A177AR80_9BILA|nr:hypothetical protein A3Q56_07760 [Intoshia linei]
MASTPQPSVADKSLKFVLEDLKLPAIKRTPKNPSISVLLVSLASLFLLKLPIIDSILIFVDFIIICIISSVKRSLNDSSIEMLLRLGNSFIL